MTWSALDPECYSEQAAVRISVVARIVGSLFIAV